MCILFFAINQHKQYPFVLLANRDEFFNRPAEPSHIWPSNPQIIAGRDIQAGGTWLGINQAGLLASLTNVRDPSRTHPNPISRGQLVSNYIHQQNVPENQLDELRNTKENYNGFNFVYGHWRKLQVYNNHSDSFSNITDGIHGLSNAQFNSPWPKVETGKQQLALLCQSDERLETEALFNLMANTQLASEDSLPHTGIPLRLEKQLSSIFITGEDYGTRCTTVITIDRKLSMNWYERTFNNQGQITNTQNFHFNIN